jgi:hypothetical protein
MRRGPFAAAISIAVASSWACGGKVSVDDDETSAATGSGGAGAFASVSSSGSGFPTGVTSGPDATSVGAGASGGVPTVGSGGGPVSHLCYRLVDESFVERITLETGDIHFMATVPPGFPPGPLSAPPAVGPYEVYDCALGTLTRTDLVAGQIQGSAVPCLTAAFLDTGILVASELNASTITYYASWEDALRGDGQAFELPGFGYSRMGAVADRVYFAWHSTSVVDRYSLSDPGDLGPMTLEGHDGWVQGLDITGDGWLVINAGISGDTLLVFDAATGTKLFDVSAPSGSTLGLTCETLIPM